MQWGNKVVCVFLFILFFLMPYQFVLSYRRILFHRRRWFRYSAAKLGRARTHVSLCRCRGMWTRRVKRRGKRHGNLLVNESDRVPAVYLTGQNQLRLVRFGVLPFGRSEYVPRVSSLDPSLSFQILRRSRDWRVAISSQCDWFRLQHLRFHWQQDVQYAQDNVIRSRLRSRSITIDARVKPNGEPRWLTFTFTSDLGFFEIGILVREFSELTLRRDRQALRINFRTILVQFVFINFHITLAKSRNSRELIRGVGARDSIVTDVELTLRTLSQRVFPSQSARRALSFKVLPRRGGFRASREEEMVVLSSASRRERMSKRRRGHSGE